MTIRITYDIKPNKSSVFWSVMVDELYVAQSTNDAANFYDAVKQAHEALKGWMSLAAKEAT